MFGQSYLAKKGAEFLGGKLGMNKQEARNFGYAAMLVTAIATLDLAGHAAGSLDDFLDDDDDDDDNWD